MTAGKFNDLRDFCFGYLVSIDAANTHTVAVDMQHDLNRLVAPLAEESLEDVNDEFHRRVIVIQEEHLVQAGFLGFRARSGDNTGSGAVIRIPPIVFLVAHDADDSQNCLPVPSLTESRGRLAIML